MYQLSSDESFHFEILRNLGHARYFGSDVSEVLECAGNIEPGNFQSFTAAFESLATRVNAQANNIDASKHKVSAREAYYRASTYWRAAEFYLHGNPNDSRINSFWDKQTIAFDKAIALLRNPGKRMTFKGDGFDIPAIFYAASGDPSTPRPTLILGNGYDGAQEEMLHVCGFAALERSFNVITYEGPGQPTVRREQNLGFITEWEKVVTPVVDFLHSHPSVDKNQVALVGYSMGGWLAARAAAFEHRINALIVIDGIFDIHQAYTNGLPPQLKDLYQSNAEGFDQAISKMLGNSHLQTSMRWGIDQGLWSFNVTSTHELLTRCKSMTLDGIAQQIQCPVWIGEAENDQFFKGQPEEVRDALGEKATYVKMMAVDGAGGHCHVGCGVLLNQLILDWWEEIS